MGTARVLDGITYGGQTPDDIRNMKDTWRGHWERSRWAWDVAYRKELGIHE